MAAVLPRHDTNLYDLRVNAGSKTTVIETTRNHRFWDLTQSRWVKAGALRYGDHLRTPSGAAVTIGRGWTPRRHTGWMWDLTVPGYHDFYIKAVTTAVLVHNCPSGPGDIQPGSYLAGKAPKVVTPGTRSRTGQYVNDLGRVEPWVAHYDEFGRLIACTDYNAGNIAQGIPAVHFHVFEYNSEFPFGREIISHAPREYVP
jgi:hypothetical protein